MSKFVEVERVNVFEFVKLYTPGTTDLYNKSKFEVNQDLIDRINYYINNVSNEFPGGLRITIEPVSFSDSWHVISANITCHSCKVFYDDEGDYIPGDIEFTMSSDNVLKVDAVIDFTEYKSQLADSNVSKIEIALAGTSDEGTSSGIGFGTIFTISIGEMTDDDKYFMARHDPIITGLGAYKFCHEFSGAMEQDNINIGSGGFKTVSTPNEDEKDDGEWSRYNMTAKEALGKYNYKSLDIDARILRRGFRFIELVYDTSYYEGSIRGTNHTHYFNPTGEAVAFLAYDRYEPNSDEFNETGGSVSVGGDSDYSPMKPYAFRESCIHLRNYESYKTSGKLLLPINEIQIDPVDTSHTDPYGMPILGPTYYPKLHLYLIAGTTKSKGTNTIYDAHFDVFLS